MKTISTDAQMFLKNTRIWGKKNKKLCFQHFFLLIFWHEALDRGEEGQLFLPRTYKQRKK